VRIRMSAGDQLPDGRDRHPSLLATLADRTGGASFVRQTASAGELGPAGERLVGPSRPDEIPSRVLDDGDRHALPRFVRRRHSLACMSAGGAPMMW